MIFSEFQKKFLVNAIAESYRNNIERISEYSSNIEMYSDKPKHVLELEKCIAIFSKEVEEIKELSNKLELDIIFL